MRWVAATLVLSACSTPTEGLARYGSDDTSDTLLTEATSSDEGVVTESSHDAGGTGDGGTGGGGDHNTSTETGNTTTESTQGTENTNSASTATLSTYTSAGSSSYEETSTWSDVPSTSSPDESSSATTTDDSSTSFMESTSGQDSTVDPTSEEPACGNGVIDPGEDCDGVDFGDVQCTDLIAHNGFPFTGGELSCNDCSFDVSNCEYCGGFKKGNEDCDEPECIPGIEVSFTVDLADLAQFADTRCVLGNINIYSNESLTSLHALGPLVWAGGSLRITDNSSLWDLRGSPGMWDGLRTLILAGPEVTITNNPETKQAWDLLEDLQDMGFTGTWTIHGNG